MGQVHRQGNHHNLTACCIVFIDFNVLEVKIISNDILSVCLSICLFAQSFIPVCAEDLLQKDFERIGRLRYKDPLNLESWRLGWFCLEASTLHVCLEDSKSRESIQLQKLLELCESKKILTAHSVELGWCFL